MLLFNPKNHKHDILLDDKINQDLEEYNLKKELINFEDELRNLNSNLEKETKDYYPRELSKFEKINSNIFLKNDNIDMSLRNQIENLLTQKIQNLEEGFDDNNISPDEDNKNEIIFTKSRSIRLGQKILTEDYFIVDLVDVLKYSELHVVIYILDAKYYIYSFYHDYLENNIFINRGLECVGDNKIKIKYRKSAKNIHNGNNVILVDGILWKNYYGHDNYSLDLLNYSCEMCKYFETIKLPYSKTSKMYNVFNRFNIYKTKLQSLEDLEIVCYGYDNKELFRDYFFSIEKPDEFIIFIPGLDISLDTIKDIMSNDNSDKNFAPTIRYKDYLVKKIEFKIKNKFED